MSLVGVASCGCGAGIGAALATLWHRKQPGPVKQFVQSHFHQQPTATDDSEAHGDLKWLNLLVTILWPRVEECVQAVVKDTVMPAIDEALPSALRGCVRVEKLSLGKSSPKLGPLRLRLRDDDAIVIDLDVDIFSDLDVSISAMRVPVGIKGFSFCGTITVCLRPRSSQPPFFGGIEIYFINPPQFDMDFSGAADIADWKVLKNAIHDAIIKGISGAMVVPARIAVDLMPDDDTSEAELRSPEPVGLMRLVLMSGKNLHAADRRFMGDNTSDPYVTMAIGQEFWKSSVVTKTVNPVWSSGNVADFLVYDRDQFVTVRVYDEDKMTSDDLVGESLRVPLKHFNLGGSFRDTRVELTLNSKSVGELSMATRWFEFTSSAPVEGISKAVAEGPSQLFVRARLEGLLGVPAVGAVGAPYTVRMRVTCPGSKDIETSSSASSKPKPDKKIATDQLQCVCENLAKRKFSTADISTIAGVPEAEVKAILGAAPAGNNLKSSGSNIWTRSSSNLSPCRGQKVAPAHRFNATFRTKLPWTAEMMQSGVVSVEVLDRNRKIFGSFAVPLADVAACEKSGPFEIAEGVSLDGNLCVMWLCEPTTGI